MTLPGLARHNTRMGQPGAHTLQHSSSNHLITRTTDVESRTPFAMFGSRLSGESQHEPWAAAWDCTWVGSFTGWPCLVMGIYKVLRRQDTSDLTRQFDGFSWRMAAYSCGVCGFDGK